MTSEKTREKLRRWSRFFTIIGFAALLVAVIAFCLSMGARVRSERGPVVVVSETVQEGQALPLTQTLAG